MRIHKLFLILYLGLTNCQGNGGGSSSSTQDNSVQSQNSTTTPDTLAKISCDKLDELNISLSLKDRISCYWLAVPANREGNSKDVIQLPVVVLRSLSKNPEPDPIIFLNGGPGLPTVENRVINVAANLEYDRDLIMMDQRGTGKSKPSLICKEDIDEDEDILGDDDDDQSSDDISFLQCYKSFKEKGIDLSNYNTKENAADFMSLVKAMELDKVNYYGLSYGTRIALELLRNHPDHIRSVILDGVLPTHIYPISETSRGLWEVLIRVAKDCTTNTECNNKYADTSKSLDFSETFTELLNEIEKSPIQHNGKTWNKTEIVTFLSQFVSSGEVVRLPYIIKKLYDKDFSMLRSDQQNRIPSSSGNSPINLAMALSVVCHDEVPFDSESRVQAELAKYHIKDKQFESKKKLCDNYWILDKKANPDIKEPVNSDIPALILSGAYDVQTPDFWAQSTKQNLSNSYYFLFPSGGHGNLGNKTSQSPSHKCGYTLGKAFIKNPHTSPPDTCIHKLTIPNFLIL